jgi:hypothetical protein
MAATSAISETSESGDLGDLRAVRDVDDLSDVRNEATGLQVRELLLARAPIVVIRSPPD